jgi:metal transporter CNNM
MGNTIGNTAIFTGGFADFNEIEDFFNVFFVAVCVLCAGLAAGLTMGLLSLDQTKLEIKAMTGSNLERSSASAILPVVKQHHLLLVTLLLFNALANESLPIFLGELVPDWMSVLISVTLVLIFGEILPSAFFTGPSQLHTAAKMIPFVKILMTLFWPVAFPLSIALDYVFGDESSPAAIPREELSALIVMQSLSRRPVPALHRTEQLDSSSKKSKKSNSRGRSSSKESGSDKNALSKNSIRQLSDFFSRSEASLTQRSDRSGDEDVIDTERSSNRSFSLPANDPEEGLSAHEVSIMTGVLKLSKRAVKHCMISIREVYMISDSTRLDAESLRGILKKGYSRVPVYRRRDKNHILGYLLVKSLVLVSVLLCLLLVAAILCMLAFED